MEKDKQLPVPKVKISLKKLGPHQRAEVFFDSMLRGLNRVSSKTNSDTKKGQAKG